MDRPASMSTCVASGGHGGAGQAAQGLALACAAPLLLDLLLQLHEAVEQRLGARRAAGHVDVHRDDLVDALQHAVAELQ